MALILLDPIRPYKVIAYGTAFRLVPGKDASGTFWRYGFEVQRAPDSGGSPGTPIDIYVTDRPLSSSGGVFVDQLPPAATYYHYRWRHIGPGFAAGAYSAYIKRAADQLPQSVLDAAVNSENIYPIDRAQTMTDGKYAVRSIDNTGTLVDDGVRLHPAVGVDEGGVVHKIYRHREEITVQGADADGDFAVTFAQTYQNVPAILFRGGQYVSYSSTLPAGLQRLRLQPLNVSASGFTSRAQIASIGATTAQTDDFASGNVITVAGNTAEVNLDPAGANDDTYTVNYRVSVTVDQNATEFTTVTLVVAIDTNDGLGGGWIERATFSYAVSTVSGPPPFETATATFNTEARQIVVSGLGLNDDIRLRAKSFTISNGTGTGSFEIRGADAGGSNPDTRNGVLYTTASDTVQSAIPAAGDSVTWVAQEVL